MYYFAFGSNINVEQMAKRCPAAVPITSCKLHGYTLEFRSNRSGRGVANIRPDKNGTVEGVLWNVTKECIAALDKYEGHPLNYRRQNIKIKILGRRISAHTYIMPPERKIKMPSYSYLVRIADGYKTFGIDYSTLADAYEHSIMKGGLAAYLE